MANSFSMRACDDPAPENGGNDCEGEDYVEELCGQEACPDNGKCFSCSSNGFPICGSIVIWSSTVYHFFSFQAKRIRTKRTKTRARRTRRASLRRNESSRMSLFFSRNWIFQFVSKSQNFFVCYWNLDKNWNTVHGACKQLDLNQSFLSLCIQI